MVVVVVVAVVAVVAVAVVVVVGCWCRCGLLVSLLVVGCWLLVVVCCLLLVVGCWLLFVVCCCFGSVLVLICLSFLFLLLCPPPRVCSPYFRLGSEETYTQKNMYGMGLN